MNRKQPTGQYLQIPKLYPMQEMVYAKAMKYNFRSCMFGRRTGKTIMVERICCGALKGRVVYLFGPSPDAYEKTWRNVYDYIGAAAESTNKTKHLMTFKNGGVLKMTSLHDMGQVDEGRGNFFDDVIYDETQSIDTEVLEKHFENSIMPALLDKGGGAWFMGTPPDDLQHYFAKLYCMGALNNPYAMGIDVPMDIHQESFKDIDTSAYISFRKTAYDNPYMLPKRIEFLRTVMPPIVFNQEFLANFVEYSRNPWLLCFDEEGVAEKRIFQPIQVNPNMPFYLAFDFNLNPMAATLWQKDHHNQMINCVAEFGVKDPKKKVSIHYTTDQIRQWFIDNVGVDIGCGASLPPWLNIYITGDATGRASSAHDINNRNFYEIIAEQFKTRYWGKNKVFQVPADNPDHKDSWAQMNSYMYAHHGIRIHPSCKGLHLDMKLTRSKEKHKIDKDHRDPHHLDTARYFFNTFLPATYGDAWR